MAPSRELKRTPSSSSNRSLTGEAFGKYRLLRVLARGGMAEVWLAEGPNPRNDELVCVKLMLPGLAHDRDFLSMFVEEAKLAAPLSHPNLVQVDDLGLINGRLYLAMEYLRGHSLSVLLKSLSGKGLTLAPDLAALCISQACRGLEYAHNFCNPDGKPLGLVHRDISPQNMILQFDGAVKVVDFGIAKATSVSGTRTTHLKGKLPYMSPEQIHGKGIDRRTDVFAMGASLFEMLCGERLFTGTSDPELIKQIMFEPIKNVRDVNPDVPEELAKIVARACSRKHDQRMPSCKAFADALDAWLGDRVEDVREELVALAEAALDPLPATRTEAIAFVAQLEEAPLQDISFVEVDGGSNRPGDDEEAEPEAEAPEEDEPPAEEDEGPRRTRVGRKTDPKGFKVSEPHASTRVLADDDPLALPRRAAETRVAEQDEALEDALAEGLGEAKRITGPRQRVTAVKKRDSAPAVHVATNSSAITEPEPHGARRSRRRRNLLIGGVGGVLAGIAVVVLLVTVGPLGKVKPAEPPQPPKRAATDAQGQAGTETPPTPPVPIEGVVRSEPEKPKTGKLVLQTFPPAKVFLEDNTLLGETPFFDTSPVELPAGEHALVLRNEVKGNFIFKVSIKPGETFNAGRMLPLSQMEPLQ